MFDFLIAWQFYVTSILIGLLMWSVEEKNLRGVVLMATLLAMVLFYGWVDLWPYTQIP